MKKVEVVFSIQTTYVGSRYSEDKEFEFDNDAEQDEIDEEIQSAYYDWLANHNQGGWTITSTEILDDEEE